MTLKCLKHYGTCRLGDTISKPPPSTGYMKSVPRISNLSVSGPALRFRREDRSHAEKYERTITRAAIFLATIDPYHVRRPPHGTGT